MRNVTSYIVKVILQILIVLAMILANGLFALSEMAVVSARVARLMQMAHDGRWGAQRALAIAGDPNSFLSVVQIGITLIGILAGAYGGATLSAPFAAWLQGWPWLAPHAHVVAMSVVVAAITYASLIIGELVPKRLAMQFAEYIACWVAPPMHVLTLIFKPLVWALDFSGDTLLRPFGLHEAPRRPVTSEELRQMARQGHAEGELDKAEMEMVECVLQLSDRPVGSVMTPRHQVEWLSMGASREELKTQVMLSRYSRFPVAGENFDEPLGVVNARDLLSQLAAGGAVDLRSMLKPPLFIPDSLSVMEAIPKLRGADCALALIIDQYGGCQGLLTLEDIMGVVTDVAHQHAGPGSAPFEVPPEGWELEGLEDVRDLQTALGLKSLPGEENDSYHTLGGLVMAALGRVPTVGDSCQWEAWTFSVREMDGQRVTKVHIGKGTGALS